MLDSLRNFVCHFACFDFASAFQLALLLKDHNSNIDHDQVKILEQICVLSSKFLTCYVLNLL